jgi:hypothetical protein
MSREFGSDTGHGPQDARNVWTNAIALATGHYVTGQKTWPSSDAKIEQQNMHKKDLQ